MKPVRLTKLKIEKLNNEIMYCYGNEINIFFIQGLFISYLSSANTEIKKATELLHGAKPVLSMSTNITAIDPEYVTLLYNGLFYSINRYCESHNNIIPMVSLDKVTGKYFSYTDLSTELQRNLLDWYLGYFYGFEFLWEHKVIELFIRDNHTLPNGVDMDEMFSSAIGTQHIIVYNLLQKFKPNFSNHLITNVVNNIKQRVSIMPKDNITVANQNAIECGCSMLSSILVIAQAALHYYEEIQSLSDGRALVH